MKLRKSIAVLMAVSMMFGSGVAAHAEGNYSEAEKAANTAAIETIMGIYDNSLKNAEPFVLGEKAASADLKLELGETTRAMVGMLASMDISWFSNLGMRYNVGVNGLRQAVTGALYLNDKELCQFEIFMDYENMEVYVHVPEVLPYYVKASMGEIYDEETAAAMAVLETFTADPMTLYPDTEVLQDILSRYFGILFDAFQDGESSEEVLRVGGMEQSSILYEGNMYEADAYSFLNKALTEIRDDEQIRTIVEDTVKMLMPGYEIQAYAELQSEVDSLIEDMDGVELSDTDVSNYITSKIWTDDAGKVIGRSVGMVDEGEEYTVYNYQKVQDETGSSMMMSVDFDGVYASLEGTSTVTDGKAEGSYGVFVDGAKAATVTVADHDQEAMKAGEINGSYTFSLEPGFVEDETFNTLSTFALSLDCDSDLEKNTAEFILGVTTSGMSLGNLTLKTGLENAEPIPDTGELEQVLDASNEQDLMLMVGSLDWTPLKENCIEAGIPEELVELADQAIYEELFG